MITNTKRTKKKKNRSRGDKEQGRGIQGEKWACGQRQQADKTKNFELSK